MRPLLPLQRFRPSIDMDFLASLAYSLIKVPSRARQTLLGRDSASHVSIVAGSLRRAYERACRIARYSGLLLGR